jgi:predicted secreted protein
MKELLKSLRRRRDFCDCRSMKVILVPHCSLNQNARVAGAAECPAAVTELIAGLLERGIGIIQMPCPELHVLGLDRAHVEIRRELEKVAGRAECRRLARDLVRQIEEYQKCGVRVLGILGKNGSPTCGVEQTWLDGVAPGMGVFIEELKAELRDQDLSMRITGMRDDDPSAALATVDLWLSALPPP